jgi:molybdate transport system ATP-binding protein
MQLNLAFRKSLQTGKTRFDLDVTLHSSAQRIVIRGPSGAGKSMMLKAIAGLVKPDSGHIQVGGETYYAGHAKRPIHRPPQARRVGYLFQDYALFPHLNVRQNIGFGLSQRWFNPRKHAVDHRVDHWLDALGMSDLAQHYPRELSGGQQQRTALARALVMQPDLLLLDEPFAALDPDLRHVLREELDRFQKKLGFSMILITHDDEDMRALGGDNYLMKAGRLHKMESLT